MAISVEDTYPGRATPADASYPEGSIKNETIPNSSDDGTPLDELWGNDFEGVKQAVMRSAGIVPTAPGDIPDTATASQILQGLIELAQGRAINYDDSGAANVYVLDVQANQQAPASLYDGQIFEFIAANSNTIASTVDPAGLGVKNIVDTSAADTIVAGERYRIMYRLGTGDFEIVNQLAKSMIRLNNTIGYGSINNKIRRFNTIVESIGSDITYVDSATLGASFTINKTGVYSIFFSDNYTASASFGFSRNTTTPTTAIQLIPLNEMMGVSSSAGANHVNSVAVTAYLEAGDIIRPHTSGA